MLAYNDPGRIGQGQDLAPLCNVIILIGIFRFNNKNWRNVL